jgi:hypothetical protein
MSWNDSSHGRERCLEHGHGKGAKSSQQGTQFPNNLDHKIPFHLSSAFSPKIPLCFTIAVRFLVNVFLTVD